MSLSVANITEFFIDVCVVEGQKFLALNGSYLPNHEIAQSV
jgi:hypothetical protein